MSIQLTYDDTLGRVRIVADKQGSDPVTIQRSADLVRWETVRGGLAVTPVSGVVRLDDYDIVSGVPMWYRVVPTPVQVLPMSGQVTTAGTGTPATLDATGFNVDLTGRMLRLTLTVSDPFKLGNLSLFLALAPNLTDNIRWRFDPRTASSRLARPGETFQVVLQFAEINTTAGVITLSPQGVPSHKSGFTAARLHVVDDGTGPVTVTLHSIEVIPAPSGAFCSITFDDSHESIALTVPKLSALGYRATDYTIASYIDQPERSTMTELQERAALGWEIAGHAYDGAVHQAALTGVTADEARADLAAMRQWLADHFPDPTGTYSFAYPQGKYELTTDGVPVDRLVREAGFASGRTVLSDVGVSTHVQIASPQAPMPYRLYAMTGISELSAGLFHPATLAQPGKMLDKVASNGGWLILVFHRIVTGSPTTTSEVSLAGFEALMDAIAARNLTVLPVREVMESVASITVDDDRVWLKSVTRPFLNTAVEVRDLGDVTRRSRQGVFEVVGRSLPVAVTDVRAGRQFVVEVHARTGEQYRRLDLLLASGDILYIQAPTTGPLSPVPTCYATVGDTSARRPSPVSEWRILSLPCTEVAAPGPDVVGATITYAGVRAIYPTYLDLQEAHPTYASLMELVGDPDEVIVQ